MVSAESPVAHSHRLIIAASTHCRLTGREGTRGRLRSDAEAKAELAGRRRLKEQSLRPPNERSVRISRTTLYKKVADVVGL